MYKTMSGTETKASNEKTFEVMLWLSQEKQESRLKILGANDLSAGAVKRISTLTGPGLLDLNDPEINKDEVLLFLRETRGPVELLKI
jgi:hypothetical protein